MLSVAQMNLENTGHCNLTLVRSWFKVLTEQGISSDVLKDIGIPIHKISVVDRHFDMESLSYGLKYADFSNCSSLTLEKCGLGNKQCGILADGLKNSTLLKTLNIVASGIGDCGATALAESLQYCTQLKSLNLSYNHITDRGALALA